MYGTIGHLQILRHELWNFSENLDLFRLEQCNLKEDFLYRPILIRVWDMLMFLLNAVKSDLSCLLVYTVVS